MTDDRRSMKAPREDNGAVLAWLDDALRQLRLAWRLFVDRRVPLWTKIVPPAVLGYVLSPVDILPDLPPMGLNQLDDLAVVLLGLKLFIELAPPEVVREHLEDLGARIEAWRVVDGQAERLLEGRHEIEGPAREEEEEAEIGR